MCVICLKPLGSALPDKDLMKTMWENNSDGAGVMLLRNKSSRVEWRKGYMEFDGFMDALNHMNIKEDDIAAYHFRITTSGGTCPEMTHPFVCGDTPDELKKLKGSGNRVFMHNGIFGAGTVDLSDTALYVLNSLRFKKSISEEQDTIATETAGSRTLTFDAREGILQTGTWIKDKGLEFSNSTYDYKSYRSYYGTDYHSSYKSGSKYNNGSSSIEDDGEDCYNRWTQPRATYYIVSDCEDSWSDECYDKTGCGYGCKTVTSCVGCPLVSCCERAEKAIQNKSLARTCRQGVDIVHRTKSECEACTAKWQCWDRVSSGPYRKHVEWIKDKGYCIAVY